MPTLNTAKLWAARIGMIAYGLLFALGALASVSPHGEGNVALALLLAFCAGGTFVFTVVHWE